MSGAGNLILMACYYKYQELLKEAYKEGYIDLRVVQDYANL